MKGFRITGDLCRKEGCIQDTLVGSEVVIRMLWRITSSYVTWQIWRKKVREHMNLRTNTRNEVMSTGERVLSVFNWWTIHHFKSPITICGFLSHLPQRMKVLKRFTTVNILRWVRYLWCWISVSPTNESEVALTLVCPQYQVCVCVNEFLNLVLIESIPPLRVNPSLDRQTVLTHRHWEMLISRLFEEGWVFRGWKHHERRPWPRHQNDIVHSML